MIALAEIKGLTVYEIVRDGNRSLHFITESKTFQMKHYQTCCERVLIEDICGDLEDLIGSPIVMAEEVSNNNITEDMLPESRQGGRGDESGTWTFYKFATIKGYVTIRWFGTSNGYYSEDVSFEVVGSPRSVEEN